MDNTLAQILSRLYEAEQQLAALRAHHTEHHQEDEDGEHQHHDPGRGAEQGD